MKTYAPPFYLIWSNEHQAWWRPNSMGYTMHVDAAGRYSREEALEIASGSRDGWFEGEPPAEIAVAQADVLAHRRQPARTKAESLMAAAAAPDLFGMAAGPMLTEKQRRRLRKSPQARGYAAIPGSGPKGETCKSCKHYVAGRYRKCGLMRRVWTRGPGTYILARTPACREWQARQSDGSA